MEEKLFFVCDSSECPNCDGSDDVIEADMLIPLYENISLDKEYADLDICSVEDFIIQYCSFGESCYLSIDSNLLKNNLIKVVNVDVDIEDNCITIEYVFEDGRTYGFDIDKEPYSKKQINLIIKLAKEIAPHLYYPNCDIKENMLTFEYEHWA